MTPKLYTAKDFEIVQSGGATIEFTKTECDFLEDHVNQLLSERLEKRYTNLDSSDEYIRVMFELKHTKVDTHYILCTKPERIELEKVEFETSVRGSDPIIFPGIDIINKFKGKRVRVTVEEIK